MFAGRFGTAAKVAVGVCVALLVIGGGWFAVGYFTPSPAVKVVDTYFAGYRDANLQAVRSVVSGDILESMPTTAGVFAAKIKAAPKDRVKSWTITKVESNPYVGQSMVTVNVTTASRTYNLVVDVFGFTEGLRVRDVQDLSGSGTPLDAAPVNSGSSTGYHGTTGSGMTGPAPGQSH